MAFSQKHYGKMLVPWFNSNEWKHVKSLIFDDTSTNISKLQALKLLQVWKIRTPKLPSGVEGTLIILDALLQQTEAVFDDKLRIFCGASIMRFLNLCGASGDRQGTFYKTAKQNHLPDWLIDLRHDIAHDQIIPSKSMLQMGLEFCLDWLQREYWEKQCITIKDFIVDKIIEGDIEKVVKIYCQMNIFRYLHPKITYIREIGDLAPKVQEDICMLNEVTINSDMVFNNAINLVLNYLCEYIEYKGDDESLADLICEVIIGNGIMFVTQLQENSNGFETIPPNFVLVWQDLLNIMYMNNMLFPLLRKLISLTNKDDSTEESKKTSSLWLAETLKCLILSDNIYKKYTAMADCAKLNKETADAILREFCQNENPELRGSLKFDFQYIENILDKIRSNPIDILNNPNVYTPNFLKYYLQLCGRKKAFIDTAEVVVKKFVIPETNSATIDKIYTLEDIEIDSFANKATTIQVQPATPRQQEIPEPQVKRWKIVKDTSIFKGCPLGVLSYQDRRTNPLFY